jgi:hypothetical protein
MNRIGLLFVLLLTFVATAIAQSNTGRLIGTVSGPDGVIAGATVVVIDDKTGRERTVTASGDGAFALPQLEVGTYTVKVSVNGFKAFQANDVKIDIGRDYSLSITLEIGKVEEAVTITAGQDVLNAVNGELSNTVSREQIRELPLNGRNPLDLIRLQPGVSQNGAQNTSINGLRTSFTNITRDGLNVQDNFIRSNATDFSPNRPSVDDTGEFTITTQNAGSDQSGGVQIRQVTPRGQKDFHGALFLFNRNSALAANSFFNNRAGIPVAFLNRNNLGGNLSGPLPLPRFGYGGPSVVRDKGFFFFGYEGLRLRQQSQRARTILTPTARQGVFTYNATATGALPANCNATTRVCTANLFALTQTVPTGSTAVTGIDPLVNQRILAPMPTVANRTDLGDGQNTTGFGFNQRSNTDRNAYTTRIDFDATERHSFSGIYTYNREVNQRPDVDDTQGFGASPIVDQSSTNKFLVGAWRWTPGGRFTNEVRAGHTRSEVPFARNTPAPGFLIGVPLVSNPEVTFLDQGRNTRYYNGQDNAELNIGDHRFAMGGQLQFFQVDAYNFAGIVPSWTLGTGPNTPQFLAGAFPGGISNNQLGQANSLFALLGGVVSAGSQSFNVENRTDTVFKPVPRFQDFRYGNHALYLQDTWRIKPNLTLTGGLRYELFTGLRLANGIALEPVIPAGLTPQQAALDPNGTYNLIGANAGGNNQYYRTDSNNFAPIFSLAWSPTASSKALSWLTGKGQFVVRGSYRQSYLNDQLITALNNAANGNVGLGTTGVSAVNPRTNTAQLDSRISGVLATPTAPSVIVPRTFAQNNGPAFSNFGTVFMIDPNIQTPRVHEYSFGIQREFGANAIEVRYVGSQANNLWRTIDYNQVDIRQNGFLADFNRARANLIGSEAFRAQQVANGTPTAQLVAVSPAFNAAVTGSQQLTILTPTVLGLTNLTGGINNANLVNNIRLGQPADAAIVLVQAAALQGTGATQRFPFLPNLNTGVANVLVNGANYNYHSLQAEFRRRFTKGFYAQANYTFSKVLTNGIGTSQTLVEPFLDNLNPGLDYARADYDQTHAISINALYELPFGNGRKFFGNINKAVDAIIGGWQIAPIIRIGSGAPITITDSRGTLNRAGRSGRQTPNSNLTTDQIRDLMAPRRLAGGVFFIDPAVINVSPNGFTAGQTVGGQATDGRGDGRGAPGFGNAAFTGQVFTNVAPGQTGTLPRMIFNGPWFFGTDAALSKSFTINEKVRTQLRLEAFNVLNRTNFFLGQIQDINSTSFGRITSSFAPRIIQLGARIDF